MRHAAFAIVFVVIEFFSQAGLTALTARRLSAPNLVDDRLIVGRSQCGRTVWLLTDAPALVRVAAESRQVSVRPIRGFRPDDRPWGLACLSDGPLWTLATPGVLARLTTDGTVIERIELGEPWLALFGWGDRLLFHRLPINPGRPVLFTSAPRRLSDTRPWPSLLTRAAADRRHQITRNLVNCGIGAEGFVPCWFTDRSQVTLSDGTPSGTSSLQVRLPTDWEVDPAAPIWDVALAGSTRMWVLTSRMGFSDRRHGGRLVKSNRRAQIESHVELNPPARVILAASERACMLLSVRGELFEVADQ